MNALASECLRAERDRLSAASSKREALALWVADASDAKPAALTKQPSTMPADSCSVESYFSCLYSLIIFQLRDALLKAVNEQCVIEPWHPNSLTA